jgi:prolipoprotein diacylglyceryltransferase
MYPTLYHALLDLTGLDLPALKFLNSFGFFVALAFVFASWTLGLELRRREKAGLLKAATRKVIIGAPATVSELLVQGVLGFVLGYKLLYMVLHLSEATADPQGFLLSGQGSLVGGLLGSAAMASFAWWDKQRNR